MEYILFIHNNVEAPAEPEQWEKFFTAARKSAVFSGGSEIANRVQVGSKQVDDITHTIGGFMRFETNNVNEIHELLMLHPIYLQGGTLELCEMPKS